MKQTIVRKLIDKRYLSVVLYCRKFGYIFPSDVENTNFFSSDGKLQKIPSEAGRRCRELRDSGFMWSELVPVGNGVGGAKAVFRFTKRATRALSESGL
ncbi:MAG: hypothetical protein HGA33_00890 [Candidatus Moranbacteria bacterium]|nr:hypothetical protein [Candidatus Moranbacteria bacterium]